MFATITFTVGLWVYCHSWRKCYLVYTFMLLSLVASPQHFCIIGPIKLLSTKSAMVRFWDWTNQSSM